MKYTEKVSEIVKAAAESKNDFDEQEKKLRDEYQRERLTGVVFAERLDELRSKKNDETMKVYTDIESTRKAYEDAVKAANIIDGSMLDKDAELLKLPVKLTADQFNALVDKHRGNSLMLELLRDYQEKNPGKYECYIPTAEQKIADFNRFCETAKNVARNPNTIQGAFFENGDYTPATATEEM